MKLHTTVNTPDYGVINSPDDTATISLPEDSVIDASDEDAAYSSMLWEYLNEGKLNNIPIDEQDKNLKIDNADLLQQAFELQRSPKTLLVYLTPDDMESQAKYDAIISLAYDGKAIILEEQREFDAVKGRFVVFLRYDMVYYTLKARYNYLREE